MAFESDKSTHNMRPLLSATRRTGKYIRNYTSRGWHQIANHSYMLKNSIYYILLGGNQVVLNATQ